MDRVYLKGLNLIKPPSEKKSTNDLPKPCFDFTYDVTSSGCPDDTYVQSISSALPKKNKKRLGRKQKARMITEKRTGEQDISPHGFQTVQDRAVMKCTSDKSCISRYQQPLLMCSI
jgi:hypothetical protein